MHRDVVHERLLSYIYNCRLDGESFEDGFYRFLIVMQVDGKKDLLTIKQAKFNKFLGFAHPVTGKQISVDEALKALEPPSFWQRYKENIFLYWDYCFRILTTALIGAIFFGLIYG